MVHQGDVVKVRPECEGSGSAKIQERPFRSEEVVAGAKALRQKCPLERPVWLKRNEGGSSGRDGVRGGRSPRQGFVFLF